MRHVIDLNKPSVNVSLISADVIITVIDKMASRMSLHICTVKSCTKRMLVYRICQVVCIGWGSSSWTLIIAVLRLAKIFVRIARNPGQVM